MSKFYRNYYYSSSQKDTGLPVFPGRRVLGGDGLESILAGYVPAIVLALKRNTVNLIKHALTARTHVAMDVIEGANAKTSLKQCFTATDSDILDDVVRALALDSLKKCKSIARCQ